MYLSAISQCCASFASLIFSEVERQNLTELDPRQPKKGIDIAGAKFPRFQFFRKRIQVLFNEDTWTRLLLIPFHDRRLASHPAIYDKKIAELESLVCVELEIVRKGIR